MTFDRLQEHLTLNLWLVLAALLLLAFGLRWVQGLSIETNILALLPATEQDVVVERASAQFNQALAQRHLILVGAERLSDAVKAADQMVAELERLPAIAAMDYRVDSDRQRKMLEPYLAYRPLLLDQSSRDQLQEDGAPAFLNRTLQLMYSPMVPVSSALLASDPLLLFYRFSTGLAQGMQQVTLKDGVLTAQQDGRSFVLISLLLDRSPFSIELQQAFLPPLEKILEKYSKSDSSLEILHVGMLRYASAGVESARQEISTIGLGSLLGVVLLLWLVFRSPRPLLMALIPIAFGFVAAFTVCQWVFGSVHLLTLVFGSSLIGISIDYSFHYFCERLGGDASWTGEKGMGRIFRGITLGLVTSVLGYISLCFAPFPGMQQLALFSTVGLAAAFLTVVCLFPRLASKPAANKGQLVWIARAGAFADRLQWRWSWLLTLLAGLTLVGLLGMGQLVVNDDIRLLQNTPQDLKAEEQRVTTILGRGLSNQFFVVEGDSPEQVLQREEALLPKLERLQSEGKLERFDALSRQLPSMARQQDNLRLIKQHLLAEPELLDEYAKALGLSPEIIQSFRVQYHVSEIHFLSLAAWLSSEAAKAWQHLWLGETERGYASVVALYAGDTDSLTQLEQQASITLVDKVSDISSLLTEYRQRAVVLVVISYSLIYVLLCFRYGASRSLRVILPAVVAVTLALGILGWCGQSLNIFHILALLLVLGIGVDYTLFLEEGREHRATTLLAIILSALTTLLSFGLLALSVTPAVAAFGMTVLIGIIVCLLLSPMLCGRINI